MRENILKSRNDAALIELIRSRFLRITRDAAKNIIERLLMEVPISAQDISIKAFPTILRNNAGKFDDNGIMKNEIIKELKMLLQDKIKELDSIKNKEEEDISSEEQKTLAGGNGNNYAKHTLSKHSQYEDAREKICDESGEVVFKYNFDKPDMPVQPPRSTDVLQRCEIQIIQHGVKFDYPIEYSYRCTQCGAKATKKAYETVSTGNKIKCEEIYNYINASGEAKSKICATQLAPDKHVTSAKDAYAYSIAYQDENKASHTANAISFMRYEPGYYEAVLFKLTNPLDKDTFHIIDIKPVASNICAFPEPKADENYFFTLQKFFDQYIKQQTGMEIYGLYPVKIALIVQKLFHSLKRRLISNVMLVGSPSTGKTLILKYYDFLLYGNLNLMSNGMSISVPAMRGTKQLVSLMGKEIKIISKGLLGSYDLIHIDEAGENKELIQNLKSFLLEDNYSYNKAESEGISNIRTCHVNVSQNLDNNHIGMYRGAIRKAYREINEVEIDGIKKENWVENWDLHMPIYKYADQPHLLKVIKEKRMEFMQKGLFWIDGYDYALHERFPFYFYLVNEDENKELDGVVQGNENRNVISENLRLVRALKSDDINIFFNSLEKHLFVDSDKDRMKKIDDILTSYEIRSDARGKIFYYNLVKMSRIINRRTEIEEMDYDLLRWFIENTNCKIDVTATMGYVPSGPPDTRGVIAMEQKIEDTQIKVDSFGIQDGEFDDN